MKHEFIDMIYDQDGIRFEMLNLPKDIPSEAYIGIFDELYIRLFDDFFEFDNQRDRVSVPFSMLADMHHLIDVYQLVPDSFLDTIKDNDIELIPFRVHMNYDDEGNLNVDFDATISASEVFFAMIVLAGETLDATEVIQLILKINRDLIELFETGVIN